MDDMIAALDCEVVLTVEEERENLLRMVAVAFVTMQALLLLNFALFRAEVEHVMFLEET